MQNNILVCITCRDLRLATEAYGDCIERAKRIYEACKAHVAAP
jgi:hypothetical protein